MNHLTSPFRRLLGHRVPTIFGNQESYNFIFNYAKAIFFWHLFTEHIGSIKFTHGPSMLPTLNVTGDAVYISKLYRRGKGIQMGDVVSVKHPMYPGMCASKRVLGMPGDFVLRDTPGKGEGMMIQVPEGHCWLAGDNVLESRDSRDYGPSPLALVRGKVVAKVWPVNEFKWIENGMGPVHS